MRLRRRSSRSRSSRHLPWYQRITRTHVGLAVAGVLGVLAVLFTVQAFQVSSNLRLAATQAEVLQGQIVAGDTDGAEATLGALQHSAEKARAQTGGPLWDVSSHVPYLGRNVSAVRTVAEAVDQIADEAMPPVVGLSEQINLNAFSPRDGKVDLITMREIRPSVIAAAEALTSVNDKLEDIDADSLLNPVRGPVESIQKKISSAQAAAVSGGTAAKLLPSMLGANETRRYLLLIQNNAETRPTGGIAGSFAILKAKDGRLSMGEQGSILDLLPFADPVLPMTAEESSVFPSSFATDLRDANLTPDFPRTAELTRAMVDKGLDIKVDGVISVDPIAMSYLLGATGPVVLADQTILAQSNAVDVLLNGVYQKYQDPVKQDDVFEGAARAIFDLVKEGKGDSRAVIAALVAAADDNRLTVWSARPAEQQEIAPTGISGVVGGDDGATPHVGVYLSDAAGGKMGYYLDYATVVRAGRCLSGDIQEITTATEIASNAPEDAARLSPYITGTGRYTTKGTIRLSVRIYSPYEGGITEVRVNGKRQTVYADRHLGRNVTRVALVVAPGESYTVAASMISGRGQTDDAVFSTTPGVNTTYNDIRVGSACR